MTLRLIPVAAMMLCTAASLPLHAAPAITVYNQDFAVVRDTVPLALQAGTCEVRFSEVTGLLEPDSVILRDPSGDHEFQILEQNYRNDPVTQGLLLSLYEDKTIDFLIRGQFNQADRIVQGKIIRSGYQPPMSQPRTQADYYRLRNQAAQPVIEVDGQLRFSLPGEPLFPDLADDTVLKPTLTWLIRTAQPARLDAELAYVTGGMSWEADYNIVAPEEGDTMDLTGWVTIENETGKTFKDARIKLMAGDVSKVQEPERQMLYAARAGMALDAMAPPVTEKAFDEYHLYTLARPTTLLDRQTKQVEFVRANGVESKGLYIYDGAKIDWNRWRHAQPEQIRQDPSYGTESNPKVWVMREFKNSQDNNLGMPLPKGRIRFYRRDTDGQVEFTGENVIDHTPKDETVRVYTGNAFDLVGERRRTDFQRNDLRGIPQPRIQPGNSSAAESFEIKVRNHKDRPVEVRIVEHLYRGANWDITAKSHDFRKIDSQIVEFPVDVPADGETTVTYTVVYTW